MPDTVSLILLSMNIIYEMQSDVSVNTLAERIKLYEKILFIYDSLTRVDDCMYEAMDLYYAGDDSVYDYSDPIKKAVVHNF